MCLGRSADVCEWSDWVAKCAQKRPESVMGRVAKPRTDTIRPLSALIKFLIEWRLIPIIPVLSLRSLIKQRRLEIFRCGRR